MDEKFGHFHEVVFQTKLSDIAVCMKADETFMGHVAGSLHAKLPQYFRREVHVEHFKRKTNNHFCSDKIKMQIYYKMFCNQAEII